MASHWLERLRNAKKTGLNQDGRKKIHYVFKDDNSEMAEEYDIRDGSLLVRKWRNETVLVGKGKWEYEIGDGKGRRDEESERESGFIHESNTNPILVRKDSKNEFQWRIRNLPYPISTYSLSIDSDEQKIVVRTSNKKYFKKIAIPDMKRASLKLNESMLSFSHANQTLIIVYKKPAVLLDMEKTIRKELEKVNTIKDEDCKQQ